MRASYGLAGLYGRFLRKVFWNQEDRWPVACSARALIVKCADRFHACPEVVRELIPPACSSAPITPSASGQYLALSKVVRCSGCCFVTYGLQPIPPPMRRTPFSRLGSGCNHRRTPHVTGRQGSTPMSAFGKDPLRNNWPCWIAPACALFASKTRWPSNIPPPPTSSLGCIRTNQIMPGLGVHD